jgi:hypothetical protein
VGFELVVEAGLGRGHRDFRNRRSSAVTVHDGRTRGDHPTIELAITQVQSATSLRLMLRDSPVEDERLSYIHGAALLDLSRQSSDYHADFIHARTMLCRPIILGRAPTERKERASRGGMWNGQR